jgi:hypothetical protein
MFAKVLNRIQHWATRRNILLALALFVILNAGILPVAGARIESYSGGIGPLDLRAAYTADQAYTALAAYGDAGRQFYLLTLLTVDLLYPLTYAVFFSLTIAYCLEPVLPPEHTLRRAALLPWVGMLADYVENAGLAWLLLNYPHRLDGLAAFTSTATTVKWIFAISSMAATAAALVALVVQRRRSGRAAGA